MKLKTKTKIIIIAAAVLLIAAICVIFAVFRNKPTSEENQNAPTRKHTLMIYMVGSDLESKSAAGSKDLEEILASGIDSQTVDVVVAAGGTARWRNDFITAEDKNVYLHLKDNTFQQVHTTESTSMGEAAPLSDFLNYCHTNYPNDEFSLIMWDHGSGPVIGYGKDILFNNDSLTLTEMKQALENSPFHKDNKLEWVGFDACLMASAELAYTWSDYANYMVASQEIEPFFGWDYSFLKNLGKTETKELISTVADSYYQYCKKYYEERGRESQFTTLSCMDLSHAKELSDAIDALFGKADANLAVNYNKMAERRVNTQEIGRASTAFDYDLIDLYDTAKKLEELYPEESQKICSVLDQMILKNVSDNENYNGISLYYPFHNKDFYEDSWKEAYETLGLFPQYRKYLASYQEKWLSTDEPVLPSEQNAVEAIDPQTFVFPLTPEQQETYADASFVILERKGDGEYTSLFSSHSVTNENGVLTADFDGRVIYAKNDLNQYLIPASTQHDTSGDHTRYSVYLSLANQSSDSLFTSVLDANQSQEPAKEYQAVGHRFQIALNNETGNVSTSALVPYDMETDVNQITGGKLEEADLSQWVVYNFYQRTHIYPQRYNNGMLKPTSEWIQSGSTSLSELYIVNGLTFCYEPLANGEYYLLFEVTDTHGNQFASELLPIQVENANAPISEQLPEPPLPPMEYQWNSADRLKVYEKDGISLYIKQIEDDGHKNYSFDAENQTKDTYRVSIHDVIFNKTVVDTIGIKFNALPNSTSTPFLDGGFHLKPIIEGGEISQFETVDFKLDIQKDSNEKTLVNNQPISITLSGDGVITAEETGYFKQSYTAPFLGAQAGLQELYQSDGLTVTLLGFGKNELLEGEGYGMLCVENNSQQEKYFSLTNLTINDVVFGYLHVTQTTIQPATKQYISFTVAPYDAKPLKAINSMKISVEEWKSSDVTEGFGKITWCEVNLSQKSSAIQQFTEGDKVLLEENGVRICLKKHSEGSRDFDVTVVNSSQESITIDFEKGSTVVDGTPYPDDMLFSEGGSIGPGQCANAKITIPQELYWEKYNQIEGTLLVKNFANDLVFFEGSKPIILKSEEKR